jgi:hypothetical protein
MPILHEGLKKEFEYVTRQGERMHIGETLDAAAPLMQEIAYNIIDVEQRPDESVLDAIGTVEHVIRVRVI